MSSPFFCLTLLLLVSPHLAACGPSLPGPPTSAGEGPETTARPTDSERPYVDAYVHGDVDFDPSPDGPLSLASADQLNFEQNLQDAVLTLKPLKPVPA